MRTEAPKGRISSIQSLGTLDGPGVRFVAFMQGCNLRCGCCHNPETWASSGGDEYSSDDLLKMVLKYREYFGKKGGVTLSGGEPLLQWEFALDFFKKCHGAGINTCLDTSGSILADGVKELLLETDRVLLDIKYPTDELYREYVGCSMEVPLKFLDHLDKAGIPTTLRQVIIPSLNDNRENIRFLKEIIKTHKCIDKTELLPFKKICKVKYDEMGIPFPFEKFDVPSRDTIEQMQKSLSENEL